MTSRERILTALAHQQPDRCPTFIWIADDTMELLLDYLKAGSAEEALEVLKIDRWRGVGVKLNRPADYGERVDRFVPDRYKNNPDYYVHETGRVVRVHPGSDYLEDTVWYPLQEVDDLEQLKRYPFPQPGWIEVPEGLAQRIQQYKQADYYVNGTISQPFKAAWLVRGMYNVLSDYLVRPELISRMYDKIYAYYTAVASHLVKAGVDMIEIIGDLGMQTRLIMSPEVWRQFDKERLRKLISTLKQLNPEVKLYMHTDGNVSEIVPDLVEVGIDILNPIQPECMPPVEIKQKYGNELVLHGAVSLQRTLPFGTPRDVKSEVRYLIENCNVSGGFVVGPSNVLFKEIPSENIVAMYEAVY